VAKAIIVTLIISIPASLALSSNLTFESESDNHMIIEINQFDKTLFYALPSTVEYDNIEVVNHNYNKEVAQQPVTTFIPNNEPHLGILDYTECSKTKPYYFDIIKKGKIDVARIHVPSIYYSNGYRYTTTTITLQINYQIKPKSLAPQKDKEKIGGLVENPEELDTFTFQSQNYQPENPDYEMVIITNESLWGAVNAHFKAWKISDDAKISDILIVNESNITSDLTFEVNGSYGDATVSDWISEGKQVTSHYNLFNDSQAYIRNYLRYCYTNHNTRYALLIGNKDLVPVRMVASYAAGTCPGCSDFYNDTSHASDMYYACLHYNMNNNTNSYFMENNVCNNSFDEIDWGYDLCVGRVPVNTVQETLQWINKSKNYTLGNNYGNYLTYGMVPATDNGGDITDTTWNIMGDQFPPNISFVNNQNLSLSQYQNAKEYVNGNETGIDGISFILQSGHYNSFWPYYNDALADNDAIPNFYYSEGCSEADFGTDTTSHFEQMMSADGSIFAGIGNSAYGWFIASTYYVEEMMNQMFNETTANFTMTFCQAHNDAREIYGHDPDCVWGMIVKETNFFGDPAQEWAWYEPTSDTQNITIVNISGHQNDSFIYTNETIVFNWTKIDNSSKYHLEIATDSDFTSLVVNLSNITGIEFPSYFIKGETNISFQLPAIYELKNYGTYYCRVRSYVK